MSIPVTGVDGSYRKIESTLVVPSSPSGILTLAEIQLQLTGVSFGSAGAAVRFDDLQVYVESQSVTGMFLFHERARSYEVIQDLVFEDQADWTQDASALRFASGTLFGERKDQSASSAIQPFLDWKGRIQLGANLLDTEAKALLSRLTTPVSTAAGVEFTLMWSAAGAGLPTARMYVNSTTGAQLITCNASYTGTTWIKDINGQEAFKFEVRNDRIGHYYQVAGTNTWLDTAWVTLLQSASAGFNFLMTLLDDLTLATGKHVTVQGVGRYKHGTRTINIPAIAGMFDNGFGFPTWFRDTAGGIEVTSGAFPALDVPIVLPVGKRITAARFRVQDNATGPTRFTCNVIEAIDFGTNPIGSGAVLSNGSGTLQTLTLPGVTGTTVQSGRTYFATLGTFTGTAITTFKWVEIDYDEL
jgi:hypothetical protein